MARPLRIQFPNAFYHVTSRGNARGRIVKDDIDRQAWTDCLVNAIERYNLKVFAYVLMDNHWHLFLKTPYGDLSNAMRDLNGWYSSGFNKRHKRAGHVFSGRYKAILVERDTYYLELSRYIHLNPVRAKMARRPEDYKWSSYPGYHWKRKEVEWISYDDVLNQFGGRNERQRYREFVREGAEIHLESPLKKAVEGLLLGSRRFVKEIQARLRGKEPDRDLPQLARLFDRPGFKEIAEILARRFGLKVSEILSRYSHGNEVRNVAVYLARESFTIPGREVAKSVGWKSPGQVSNITRIIRSRFVNDREFARFIKETEIMVRKDFQKKQSKY